MPLENPNLEKDKNVSELLTKCESFLLSRNFEEAISGCRAILTISPENQRARELLDEAQSRLEAELFIRENLRKAQEFFRIRDFQKCINECQKIQLLDAENSIAQELTTKAQEKLEAEPFVQNFINSGRSLFDSGLYEEAIAQWEKVRSIDPEFPDLDRLINNARHKLTAGTPSSAPLFDLSPPEAVETGEGFGFVSDQERIGQLLEEGDRLFNNEQYQKAIEVWSEIFMVDVNHPEALQRIEQARAAAAEQRLKVKDLVKNAQMAYEQGNIDLARDGFNQVLSIDGENSEANKYLALIEKADREPQSLGELIARGEAAESQGQYREAAQFFSQALAIESENGELADKIKNLNLLAKKQEQAKAFLGNARGFVVEGKFDSARHALGKVLELEPANQEAMDLLKEIKEKLAAAPAGVAAPAARGAEVAAKKPFPVVPAAIAGALVIVLGAGYFFFFGGERSPQKIAAPPKHPAVTPSKTPHGQAGSGSAAASPGGTVGQEGPGAKGSNQVVLDLKNVDRISLLLKEANFYYTEKHYPEALKKAEEALQIDPGNKDAISLRLQAQERIQDQLASEQKMLNDANTYFEYSEFAGAVKLYEKYLGLHPETRDQILPQVIKCYYNLGVLAIREWRCEVAADYFRQVLFIDETDQLSKDALATARRCQKSGTTDIDVRKAVALMEIRR